MALLLVLSNKCAMLENKILYKILKRMSILFDISILYIVRIFITIGSCGILFIPCLYSYMDTSREIFLEGDSNYHMYTKFFKKLRKNLWTLRSRFYMQILLYLYLFTIYYGIRLKSNFIFMLGFIFYVMLLVFLEYMAFLDKNKEFKILLTQIFSLVRKSSKFILILCTMKFIILFFLNLKIIILFPFFSAVYTIFLLYVIKQSNKYTEKEIL